MGVAGCVDKDSVLGKAHLPLLTPRRDTTACSKAPDSSADLGGPADARSTCDALSNRLHPIISRKINSSQQHTFKDSWRCCTGFRLEQECLCAAALVGCSSRL
jgi:hypothetical protein